VFTSKHHDGYCNWPSTYSYGWNSEAVGPRRNVLAELKSAFDREQPDIHFGLYYSLYEWFNPMYVKDRNSSWVSRLVLDRDSSTVCIKIYCTIGHELVVSLGIMRLSKAFGFARSVKQCAPKDFTNLFLQGNTIVTKF
jgi:hypothetical protein